MSTPWLQPAESGHALFRACCPIVLASASPRRQQFLRELGLAFDCRPSQAPEEPPFAREAPEAYALRLARSKAEAVDVRDGKSLVIAADTIVVLRNRAADAEKGPQTAGSEVRILGKPVDAADALDMLCCLNGREHEVITAVHMLPPAGEGLAFADCSRVCFHRWPVEVLAAYVRTKEPFDKAGAYAVQGQGAFLVASISGSWSTIVGLPVTRLAASLLERGLIEVL